MTGSPVINHLTEHLKRSLVLISGLDRGSGFFIAPNTIATCAHVAGASGAEVTVGWQGRSLAGVVRWASAPGGRGQVTPYPDVALIEVDLPDGGHRSVWLDDHRARPNTELVAAGHARVYSSAPEPVTGWYTHRGEYAEMIRLTDDLIEPGMSGGPVLNTVTGGVCGITKAARMKGQPAAGGVAVPVRALREIMPAEEYRRLRRRQEDHHRRNRSWLLLAGRLPLEAGTVAGWAERELRLILGMLPAAGHDELFDDYLAIAGDRAVPVSHRLHDHGDVVAELAGLPPADEPFPDLLAYALHRARSADPRIAAQLTQWALMAAPSPDERELVQSRLAGAVPAGGDGDQRPAGVPSVLVHVRPSGPDRQRYRCEIWRHDGDDLSPVETEGPDRSAEELRGYLRDRLPGLIRRGQAEGPAPMIELVLPADLIDEEVERWPRTGRNPWPLIGQKNPVVVRDQERFELDPVEPEDEEILVNWQARWDALAGRRIGGTVLQVDCDERRDETALYSELELHTVLGAVVLPDTPRQRTALRTVLDVGLYTGVPIMVWRRSGCGGGDGVDHDDCAGARLASAVRGALAESGRDDVPEQIMRLRNQAAAGGQPECGNDLVLFWDDPGRRPRRSPMTAPRGDAGG
ncbi:VMAP-C domain-containing protein [Actinoplanes subglobosus]|uniref:Trypsin-like peptidase domain-containing protein n=1 Tax=Actinoplanes subglobosus TaxID=1547892 RepID=A0ABV8IHG2_9ACTN